LPRGRSEKIVQEYDEKEKREKVRKKIEYTARKELIYLSVGRTI